jgi:PIN domain nuclease of toxin-antitoxin system
MKLLLDTHAFLWWITDNEELSPRAREVIADSRNELFLSAASGCEISIKTGLGRIQLPKTPDNFLLHQLSENAITPLSISIQHALHVLSLPDIHRDPFDRIIVAQAILEKMTILTRDAFIRRYDVPALW